MSGPLHGLRVVSMGGIGPGPFCTMLLADLGADVLRIDRRTVSVEEGIALLDPPVDVLARSQRSIALDLKDPADQQTAMGLIMAADVLIEGFRPGVMERLGLGPERCLEGNPRLVYGRMTGWGQTGPLAHSPGHDIHYIALAGALASIGQAGAPPTVPLNLVGDYGGGGLFLAFGILSALFERDRSGQGQVVDAAMVDGAATLMTAIYGLKAAGLMDRPRGGNLLDGGAPFNDCYECADGRFIAVGAVEPRFYRALLDGCGVADDPAFSRQYDVDGWPNLKERFAALFRTRTRDAWCALLEGTDACVAPVLDSTEAPLHSHNRERGTFIDVDGVIQPAPAPRFSRTPAAPPGVPSRPGQGGDDVLREWAVMPTPASPS